MTKEQQQIRNKIFYELWKNYKKRWDMDQLAEMVNCPLPTFYEIVRKESQRLSQQKAGKMKKEDYGNKI